MKKTNSIKRRKFGSAKKIAAVNIVTALRFLGSFLIIPIFKALGGVAAAVFSGVFMLTDWVDGFLARKLKASTFFGSAFDGLTDKMFAILTLGLLFCVEPGLYLAPIVYELYIMNIQKKKMAAGLNVKSNMNGKIKTWVISASMMVSLALVEIYDWKFFGDYKDEEYLAKEGTLAFILATIPTILFQAITAKSYKEELNDKLALAKASLAKHDIEYIDASESDLEKLNGLAKHMEQNAKDEEEDKKKAEEQAKREMNKTLDKLCGIQFEEHVPGKGLTPIPLERTISKEDLEAGIAHTEYLIDKFKQRYTLLEQAKILKDALFDPAYYAENKDKQIRVLTKELFEKNEE